MAGSTGEYRMVYILTQNHGFKSKNITSNDIVLNKSSNNSILIPENGEYFACSF